MARPKIYSINENFFEKIDSHAKSYILGFLYADGSVSDGNLSICIHKKDLEILNFIKDSLCSTHPIKPFCNTYIRLSISNKKIVSDLNKLGIIKNKTYNIKKIIYNEDFFDSFVRGLFDGDGSIYISGNRNETTINFSGNKYVLLELKNIFKNILGIHSFLRQRRDNDFCWGLFIRGSIQIKCLYDFMYKNDSFSLKRKKDKFVNCLNLAKKSIQNKNTRNNILKLYALGNTQADISRKLNINYSTVRSTIQRARVCEKL